MDKVRKRIRAKKGEKSVKVLLYIPFLIRSKVNFFLSFFPSFCIVLFPPLLSFIQCCLAVMWLQPAALFLSPSWRVGPDVILSHKKSFDKLYPFPSLPSLSPFFFCAAQLMIIMLLLLLLHTTATVYTGIKRTWNKLWHQYIFPKVVQLFVPAQAQKFDMGSQLRSRDEWHQPVDKIILLRPSVIFQEYRRNNSSRCLLRAQDAMTLYNNTRCPCHLYGHPSKNYPCTTLHDFNHQMGTAGRPTWQDAIL